MVFNDRMLADGEYVELHLRTHAKALVRPLIVLVLIVLAAAVAIGFVRRENALGWLTWVVLALALLAFLVWVLVPFLAWRTTVYVFTNRRLVTREGIVTRSGRDIPLYRINDIAIEKGLLDRILGCGTLIVSDATEKAGVRLHDVPRVERVHVHLNELLFDADDGSDDGEYPPREPRRGRGRAQPDPMRDWD